MRRSETRAGAEDSSDEEADGHESGEEKEEEEEEIDEDARSSTSSCSSTESEHYEPWGIVPGIVHLAVYARDVIAPLSMASRPELQKDWIDDALNHAQAVRPAKPSKKPDQYQHATYSDKDGSSGSNDKVSNEEVKTKRSADSRKNDEPDPATTRDSLSRDWDQSFVTVAATAVSIGGLKSLHENSASSSYTLVVPDPPSSKARFHLWVRVSFPDFQREGVSLLQVQLNGRWHSEQWRLKTSTCEPNEWHWQRYPHALHGKLFADSRADLRILHNSMGIRMSALWFSPEEQRRPPGHSADTRPPTRVLHCYPVRESATFRRSKPWTAFRVPDDPEVRKKLTRFQHMVVTNTFTRSTPARRVSSLSAASAPGDLEETTSSSGPPSLFQMDDSGEGRLRLALPQKPASSSAASRDSFDSSSEDDMSESDDAGSNASASDNDGGGEDNEYGLTPRQERYDFISLINRAEQASLDAAFERLQRGELALASNESGDAGDLPTPQTLCPSVSQLLAARHALRPVTLELSRSLCESKANITSKLVHRLVDGFQISRAASASTGSPRSANPDESAL